MLALTRRINESIILTITNGQKITVMVTDVIDNIVRIGIKAPKRVEVIR